MVQALREAGRFHFDLSSVRCLMNAGEQAAVRVALLVEVATLRQHDAHTTLLVCTSGSAVSCACARMYAMLPRGFPLSEEQLMPSAGIKYIKYKA